MSVLIQCSACGKSFPVSVAARSHVACPGCGQTLIVPPQPPPPPIVKLSDAVWPLLPTILMAAAIPIVLIVILHIVFNVHLLVIAFLLLLVLSLPIGCIIHVLLAKARAFRTHLKEVSLFFGLVKLVLWDPTEGIVLLKNKQVVYVDDNQHDGGGVRFVYPFLGEEVGLRVPLTLRPVEFRDKEVFTRDSIPLTIRVAVWWRVRDLRDFYHKVSHEIHKSDDEGRPIASATNYRLDGEARNAPQLQSAERWITILAEEQTRAFVSELSTSLLVADQILAALPAGENTEARLALPGASGEQTSAIAIGHGLEHSLGKYQTASSLLAERLQPKLHEKLGEIGVEIDRVALQEVSLPKEIHDKATAAAKAWYGIIEAKRRGVGMAAQLEEQVRILGKDAIAEIEKLKHFSGTNVKVDVGGLGRLLDAVFANVGTG